MIMMVAQIRSQLYGMQFDLESQAHPQKAKDSTSGIQISRRELFYRGIAYTYFSRTLVN